jgi:hypothetical protein
MEEKINVAKMKTGGKGIFDMTEVYQNMKYWLDYQGYGDENKSFIEEKYVERIKGEARQIEIRWNAEKKINDYVTYSIGITFFVLGLQDVEIEKDGKKIGSQKGDVEIRFDVNLILDKDKNPGGEPKFKWKSKFFQKIYNEYIIKDRINSHAGDLYSKSYSLYNEVKTYFDMRGG